MPRETFERQLQELQDLVLEMGSMVDHAVDRAMTALLDRDAALAQQVVENDKLVNAKNLECQNDVIALIAQQAPMARDLRLIISVAAIMTDLERMGDHAEGIGRIVVMMQDEPLVKPLIDIPIMAGLAREMMRDAVQAFVDQDVDSAFQVGGRDDEVDNLYDRVYRDLVDIMVGDPSTIEPSTHLLWVAHNLERIADRATNIAERTVYSATGKLPQMDISSY
ncbi:MAG: phosphate signaling complex protein PhoU [Chloroflexi bacterium]|nr:phosphate signaling complex protein PhoU [Chloroflexota bacterium]MQC47720.1 phosphate transport system regulatory protein PhoU [Chloroflexota bacterium]